MGKVSKGASDDMANEVQSGLRLIDTEHGKQIHRAALAALDTHFSIAKQILELLMQDHSSPVEVKSTFTGHDASGDTAAMDALLRDQVFAHRRSKTRIAYSANPKGLTQEGLAALAPAQIKILQTLTKAPQPLDVIELTQNCGLQKKTVTNALSLLKARKLIGTHEKKQ